MGTDMHVMGDDRLLRELDRNFGYDRSPAIYTIESDRFVFEDLLFFNDFGWAPDPGEIAAVPHAAWAANRIWATVEVQDGPTRLIEYRDDFSEVEALDLETRPLLGVGPVLLTTETLRRDSISVRDAEATGLPVTQTIEAEGRSLRSRIVPGTLDPDRFAIGWGGGAELPPRIDVWHREERTFVRDYSVSALVASGQTGLALMGDYLVTGVCPEGRCELAVWRNGERIEVDPLPVPDPDSGSPIHPSAVAMAPNGVILVGGRPPRASENNGEVWTWTVDDPDPTCRAGR